MKKIFSILVFLILVGCQKQKVYDKTNGSKKITKEGKTFKNTEKYFGHYDKPELLAQLEKYDEVSDGKISLGLGCSLSCSYSLRYPNTPIDVIPFAYTGGDGVHFGFLTDFGTVKDLNNAPIVCISPLGDPPVQIVAKNLKDFFRLIVSVNDIDDIEYWYRNERSDIIDVWEDGSDHGELDEMPQVYERIDMEKMLQMDRASNEYKMLWKQFLINIKISRIDAIKMFAEKYHIFPQPNIVQYIKDVNKKRQSEITIPTKDGIGIIYPKAVPIHKVFNYRVKDPQIIKNYLLMAPKADRIKFYRDASFEYILSKNYDFEIRKVIVNMLKKDGFNFEAKRLNDFQ